MGSDPGTRDTRQELFARERRRYERAIMVRMRGTLTREDAEDIVSEALIDSASRCPDDAAGEGRLWFMRVVLNRAEDFRRSRYGRPRSVRVKNREPLKSGGPLWSFVSWDEVSARALGSLSTCSVAAPTELLEADAERNRASALVARGLRRLTPSQQRLLRLRYLQPVRLTRTQIADRLGLSLTQYETRHTIAWREFAQAVQSESGAGGPSFTLGRVKQHVDDEQAAADGELANAA
jgi:RNA polymerase sigma factor (sigma-70 family)